MLTSMMTLVIKANNKKRKTLKVLLVLARLYSTSIRQMMLVENEVHIDVVYGWQFSTSLRTKTIDKI